MTLLRSDVETKLNRASFDDLMFDIVSTFKWGEYEFTCNPRGKEIKELFAPKLVLRNPRNRLISAPSRNVNYGFGVGEFLWYFRGSESLEEMLYYNKRMADYSNDGKTLNSAYGKRIFNTTQHTYTGQWEVCVDELLADKDSRRAVLFICNYKDVYDRQSKDIPCTLSLQFFIRNKKLHLVTTMRSNDVMWGLTYDLFSFTLFQEMMLLELNSKGLDLELGSYVHNASSLHIYEMHYDLINKMYDDYSAAASKRFKGLRVSLAEPQLPISSFSDISELQLYERHIRECSLDEIVDTQHNLCGTIGWMADRLAEHRRKREKEHCK